MSGGSLGTVVITAKSVSGSAAALQMLRDAGCELRLQSAPLPWQEADLIGLARDADALVFAMEPMGASLMAAAPRLKVIARPGVGCDTVDIAAATHHGVAVTVALGANHESVADFTLALLLLVARGIGPAALSVQQGGWLRLSGTEVWGKTLAIVGLGRIGRAVARRALGFDMRVLAVGNAAAFGTVHDTVQAPPHGVTLVGLDEALRTADFVSLHAPLTPATQGLINTRTLALMKPGAFLINTSRGGLVDETALAQAVRSGHLGGAAVDVLCQQGEGSQSPLIGVPGIVVTPHMATLAREATERVAQAVARSVLAALRGKCPPGLVNTDVAWRFAQGAKAR